MPREPLPAGPAAGAQVLCLLLPCATINYAPSLRFCSSSLSLNLSGFQPLLRYFLSRGICMLSFPHYGSFSFFPEKVKLVQCVVSHLFNFSLLP